MVDAGSDDLPVLDVKDLRDRHRRLGLGETDVLDHHPLFVRGEGGGLVAEPRDASVRARPPCVKGIATDELATGVGVERSDLRGGVRRVLGVERDQRRDVVRVEGVHPRPTDPNVCFAHRAAAYLGLALLLAACGGSARALIRDDEGGLFQLEGDDAEARRDAERQMVEHCGGRGYRIVYDGGAPSGASYERAPTADEAAERMALPSDLPGAIERPGLTPPGGAGVTTDGNFFMHDPARSDRAASTGVDRRRRLEYECELEDDDEDTVGDEAAERIAIPAQSFEMGSPDDEPSRDADEGPQLVVEVGAFSIDRTPVTVRAFRSRLDEVRAAAPGATILSEADTPDDWIGHCNLGSTRSSHPANCVSVDAARAYCRLVGGDLPTEAERELAMRAGSTTAYWWGTDFDAEHAPSSVGCGIRGCRGGTEPIARTGPRCNALGICDLTGNVWEWTLTEYAPELGPYVSSIPALDATFTSAVHRGGSWIDEDPRRFRSAFRGVAYPENGLTGVGFRCVVRD